ncbi:hypothetical protein Ahy_B04g073080 isoform B [Arachis hypogaea]|uniref:Uncharacterized protein n=1 Tax=Arachis hypogaea TaxID=3818 RepID=A0A444ZPN4_ARAHY|nr:hypothetical protein Ahy_B04g073080 isoform B [Arachis hypogaea]
MVQQSQNDKVEGKLSNVYIVLSPIVRDSLIFLFPYRENKTFYKTHFIDEIYYYYSYFSNLTNYSKILIIPFPNISNDLFLVKIFFFFITWELELIPVLPFSFYFCYKIADYIITHMVAGHPRIGTLHHLYAFSRNLVKNGRIWIGSN